MIIVKPLVIGYIIKLLLFGKQLTYEAEQGADGLFVGHGDAQVSLTSFGVGLDECIYQFLGGFWRL